MKQALTEAAIAAGMAITCSLILIPLLIKYSRKLGLVDKPDPRKLHREPIPVAGGIAIVLASVIALAFSKTALQLLQRYPVLVSGSLLLLVTGVWDDRKNLRPLYRLALQFLCAAALAANGVRITSLHGILGIHQLPEMAQYAVTIIVIAGVANAFNLIDGIDGLAGGLAVINLFILGGISLYLQQYSLFILFAALSGAILVFLKYNYSPAKIFMGDGGSLFLGFILPATGIILIEQAHTTSPVTAQWVILLVFSLLLVPVFDSLRVYVWRMRRGESPFRADKTHLHHLFLTLGFNHKKTALIIYVLEVAIVCSGVFFLHWLGISWSIAVTVALFLLACQLLQVNYSVEHWKNKIKKMEEEV